MLPFLTHIKSGLEVHLGLILFLFIFQIFDTVTFTDWLFYHEQTKADFCARNKGGHLMNTKYNAFSIFTQHTVVKLSHRAMQNMIKHSPHCFRLYSKYNLVMVLYNLKMYKTALILHHLLFNCTIKCTL